MLATGLREVTGTHANCRDASSSWRAVELILTLTVLFALKVSGDYSSLYITFRKDDQTLSTYGRWDSSRLRSALPPSR